MQEDKPVIIFDQDLSPFLQLYIVTLGKLQKIQDGKIQIQSRVDDQGGIKIEFEFGHKNIKTSQIQPFLLIEHNLHIELYFEVSPHLNTGFYSIIIKKTEGQLNALVSSLRDCFQFYNKQTIDQIYDFHDKIRTHVPTIFEDKPLVEQEDQDFNYSIVKGGYMIGEGFEWIGDKVSKGTDWVGSKLETNVKDKSQKYSEQHIQKKTLKMEKRRQKTKKGCEKTKSILENIFTPIANYFNKGADKLIDKTKNSESSKMRKIYDFGKQTNHAFTSMYRGMSKGCKSISNSVGNNTRKVMNKKYGQQYTEAYLGKKQSNQDIEYQQVEDLQQQPNQINVQSDIKSDFQFIQQDDYKQQMQQSQEQEQAKLYSNYNNQSTDNQNILQQELNSDKIQLNNNNQN